MISRNQMLHILTNVKFFKKFNYSSMVKYATRSSLLSCYFINPIFTSGFLSTHNVRHITTNSISLCARSHTCGELRVSHVGQKVRISGWLQFQRGGVFITLRDAYGNIQCIIPKVNLLVILSTLHK